MRAWLSNRRIAKTARPTQANREAVLLDMLTCWLERRDAGRGTLRTHGHQCRGLMTVPTGDGWSGGPGLLEALELQASDLQETPAVTYLLESHPGPQPVCPCAF